MPKRDDRRYGLPTAIFVALGGAVLALVDQLVAPDVEISPVVYALIFGVALEAYPGIVTRIMK